MESKNLTLVLVFVALAGCDRRSGEEGATPAVWKEPASTAVTPEMEQRAEEDAIVTGRVQTSFTSEGLTPPLHRVIVTTRDGVVTLKGKVNGREARVRAGTIAQQTLGVSGVNNQLLYDHP